MQYVLEAVPDQAIALLAGLFNDYRIFYGQASDLAGAERYLRERKQNQESQIFWAQDLEGNPLGFVQLYPSFSSVSMQRLWILNDLYVAPEARRQGLGEALMQKARQFAIETGAKGISLETGQNNHAAQALYEKLGYVKNEEYFVYYLSTP